MSIETIYRAIVQSVVKSHNYNHFSQTIKSKFGFILDYIDKWNPELREHNCSIMTKVYQFYHNDKRFGKCHNELCTNMFYNVRTFNNGFPVCCSFSCRAEYFKTHLLGENNPNFGHKWSDDMKKVASENTKRQMQNPYYRYVANQPKTEESKLFKGRKISEAHKRLFNEHPERYKCKHHFTQEERKRIGEKSKQKFTPEYIECYRKRMESLGNWIPKELKTDYEVYYNESNWKYRMFDLIEDKSQLDMLNQFGVFNAFTNSKGVVRDHIYSRHSGFIQRVFPEIMRHPCNCQIILHSSNVKKRGGQYIDRDDQTLEQLFQRILDYTGNWCEQEICLRKIQEYKNGKRWTNPYKNSLQQ